MISPVWLYLSHLSLSLSSLCLVSTFQPLYDRLLSQLFYEQVAKYGPQLSLMTHFK